jgi:hypothetical protein
VHAATALVGWRRRHVENTATGAQEVEGRGVKTAGFADTAAFLAWLIPTALALEPPEWRGHRPTITNPKSVTHWRNVIASYGTLAKE